MSVKLSYAVQIHMMKTTFCYPHSYKLHEYINKLPQYAHFGYMCNFLSIHVALIFELGVNSQIQLHCNQFCTKVQPRKFQRDVVTSDTICKVLVQEKHNTLHLHCILYLLKKDNSYSDKNILLINLLPMPLHYPQLNICCSQNSFYKLWTFFFIGSYTFCQLVDLYL